jgi:hypothetical protein
MAPRTLQHVATNGQRPSNTAEQILDGLKQILRELRTQRRLFDEFAGAFLNARFSYGKPTDRWRPRG